MSEKAFWGVSVSTKGGHSKLRGQPLQRHASVWWRCVQMAHGEDLDRLNGGSETAARAPCTLCSAAELNKIGWSKAQQTTPYQCGHPIFYSLPSREFTWLYTPEELKEFCRSRADLHKLGSKTSISTIKLGPRRI